MTRQSILWCAAALAAGTALAAQRQGGWRVVAAAEQPPAVPLPALARVHATDRSGETWRQTGELGGSVAAARREFVMALGAAGWALDKTIALGRSPARSELMVWTRQKRRILFMVWEKEAGTCGFAWGEENETERTR
jgi:hypothetical protein